LATLNHPEILLLDKTARVGLGVPVALATGLTLIALALALTLTRSPLVVAATNSIPPETTIATTRAAGGICQQGETLPGATTAMRISVSATIGPRVTVTALSGSRVIARGTRGPGWTGENPLVAVRRIPQTIPDARVCVALGPALGTVGLLGAPVDNEGHAKLRIEYLRPGPRSWWSLASATARRMGLGRSPGGTWVALVALALMATAAVLASWLILGWVGRSGPPTRAAWICALVACLSAASWSIVTPPFQTPDEPSHFAYAQLLAETGRLPTSGASNYSPAEDAVLEALEHLEVRFKPATGTISSAAQQRSLEAVLAQPLARHGAGGAGVAATEPPLYYALEAVPSILASGGNLLDQLTWMRLFSALLAGVAVLFVYLFLREALPAAPWAWTVGALGVALYPLLGFMSGSVTPEALLCAVSAALFYCLARAFRRGLTPRLAVAIGTLTAGGFLTKLNFVGLAPGVALALIVLTRRAARTSGRSAYRSLALAAAIGASPVYLYAIVNVLSNHAGLGLASSGIGITAKQGSPLDELSYIWQFYLPRLPGMATDFPGISPLRQLWFDRTVGMYGWLDTFFPEWVYNVALIPAALIAALCARTLYLYRAALRRRAPELAVYAVIAVGVPALVGADSYLEYPGRSGGYSEPRYLLPLAALFGAVLALAARGAGRRLGPAVGTLIVVLILGHDIFSQLLTVARYYV
jgi:Predicted membrane protein (DUF2142)